MVVATLLLLNHATQASASSTVPEAFLTRPDIHGNKVVFSAEGDLWVADATTGDAKRLTNDPGVETNPRFSPDGTMIAYTATYDGNPNVYVIPSEGGIPKRLTYDSESALVLGWTPDGKVLFRTASKLYTSEVASFSTNELFTVPVTGGLPIKLAVPTGQFGALSQDGHTLAFVPTSNEWMNWFRYEAGEADQIWLADLASGKFSKLTNEKGVNTQPAWLGKDFYFVSERTGVRNLWRLDPSTRKLKQITTSQEAPVRWPSSDGKKVIFELGPRLAVFDPEAGQTKVIPIHLFSDHIHARPYEVPVVPTDGACVGPTGKRVAVATRGHLITAPAGEGTFHTITGESGQRLERPSWSPDGKWIAYISDSSKEQEIYLADANSESLPKALTKGLKGQNSKPVWSPDGKWLLVGNRTGDIKLIDAKTGAIKVVAHSKGVLEYDVLQTDFRFSPDSKWVAYTTQIGNDINVAHIYEMATGKSTPITDPNIDSQFPNFSSDGKYLFVVQNRHISMSDQTGSPRIKFDAAGGVTAFTLSDSVTTPFTPKNDEEGEAPKPKMPEKKASADSKSDKGASGMKVDLEAIQSRYFDLKVPTGIYSFMAVTGDRLILQQPGAVVAFDIASKTVTPLASAQVLELSGDGKKLLLAGPGGLQVVDASGGPVGASGAVKLQGHTVTVDPVAEWHQIFEETWRLGRDLFYDPNLHGVDWSAVHAKYEKRLPLIGSRDDLTRLQADLISELNTGHCYVGGPSNNIRRPNRQGVLGVDLIWEKAAKAYKITHILKGNPWDIEDRSPLATPGLGVHEGDYLLKIRGTVLREDQDPNALLLGTIGQEISVTTNSKPDLATATDHLVEPIAGPVEQTLRTRDWIESRKAYVEKASGGKIAYVHLGDMEGNGGVQFAQGYYPNVTKAAIIVDVRGNGGGYISGNILGDLASKVTGRFELRAGGEFRREGWAPLGQVVALTDEWAFSDGEYFSEFFKRLKIGPLVGHRTGGGEVGSGGGYPLIDGGVLNIPNYGAWAVNDKGVSEWVIEGRGAVPDVEVDQDPAALMAGKDPQLDKAIEIILDNLKKHPFVRPEHPAFPVKLGGSRAGAR